MKNLKCSFMADSTFSTLNLLHSATMGKCDANHVRSIVLPGGGRSQLKLWSASFRRILLDTVRCGGRHNQTAEEDPELKLNFDDDMVTLTLRSELKKENAYGSDKLLDLLMLSESSEEEEVAAVKRKAEVLEELKRVVNNLQAGHVEVLEGAKEVRRLSKDDSDARATLAMLGAIPPLVGLLDAPDLSLQIAALYALLNLGVGNDANKAAIVKAGAIHKMLKLIESTDATLGVAAAEAIVANFLALSALDANKPIIGLSGALPFLVRILLDPNDIYDLQAKQDALGAVYNLSILSPNIFPLLETNVVPFFLSRLGDMDMSERILAILGNIVSVPEGRKAVSCVPDAFPILVDVLNWTDSPGCQEKVSYILMVMAHKAYGDRQSMIEAGIMSSLLELTLLGTMLAQKRASRILECLTVDKGKQVSESCGGGGFSPALSAPLSTSKCSSTCTNHELVVSLVEDDQMMSEERKAVKQLVQQSLQTNMKRIAKRANLPHDFVPSDHLKAALTSSSTSKSLPF